MYNKAKKETKKVVSDAKFKAYNDLYNRLGTRESEKDTFKLAKIRERTSRDLNQVKYIKSVENTNGLAPSLRNRTS